MFARGGTTNTGIMDGFEDMNTEDRVTSSNLVLAMGACSMRNDVAGCQDQPETEADPSRLDELRAGVREAADSTIQHLIKGWHLHEQVLISSVCTRRTDQLLTNC